MRTLLDAMYELPHPEDRLQDASRRTHDASGPTLPRLLHFLPPLRSGHLRSPPIECPGGAFRHLGVKILAYPVQPDISGIMLG